MVVGAASALELTGTALAAAGATEVLGCSTALLAGFSATPWGLLITMGGALIAAGSALVFDFAQPFARRLMELERALDNACRQEVRAERLLVSTRLDALLREVDGAWRRGNGVAG